MLEKSIKVRFKSNVDAETFCDKMDKLTRHLNCSISELTIKLVLSTPLDKVSTSHEFSAQNSCTTLNSVDTEQLEVIGTCKQSLEKLMLTSYKAGLAGLPEPTMELTRRTMHTGIFNINSGQTSWQRKSSPYTKNGLFLINSKIAFAALVSGMLIEVYKMFSLAANFGIIIDDTIERKITPVLQTVVKEASTKLKDAAIISEAKKDVSVLRQIQLTQPREMHIVVIHLH